MINKSRPALQRVLTEILENQPAPELEGLLPIRVRLLPNDKWPSLNVANPEKIVDASVQLLVRVRVPVCRTNVWWMFPGRKHTVELKPDPQGAPRWNCSCGAEKYVCDHVSEARLKHERTVCRWNHEMDPSVDPAPATVYRPKEHCPHCKGPLEYRILPLYPSLYEILGSQETDG